MSMSYVNIHNRRNMFVINIQHQYSTSKIIRTVEKMQKSHFVWLDLNKVLSRVLVYNKMKCNECKE